MRPKMGFVLLLLAAVCILSVYSCMEAVPAALTTVQTEDISYHTYRYSMNHITDIQISVKDAAIYFYTEPKRDEIVIQVKGAAIEGAETEKSIVLESTAEQACQIDVYLPERFYNIQMAGDNLTVNTIHTMRGTMKIQANCLDVQLDDYCGGISFFAKTGCVSLKNGNLQKTSYVTLAEKGNIYLDTKITDTTGISSFSTGQGTVKVQTNVLEENTFFEVTALSVFGTYAPLDATKRRNCAFSKVQIFSQNGIVYFMN